MKLQTWYQNGLRFECTQCGHCCTVSGYVWVRHEEMYRIAEYLEMRFRDFTRKNVRQINQHYSLIEAPDGGCIFYENGCRIYPVRPGQCSSFPFWKEILEKPENWQKQAECCPGMNQGKLHTGSDIESYLKP